MFCSFQLEKNVSEKFNGLKKKPPRARLTYSHLIRELCTNHPCVTDDYLAVRSNFIHVREPVWTFWISMSSNCHSPFTFLTFLGSKIFRSLPLASYASAWTGARLSSSIHETTRE